MDGEPGAGMVVDQLLDDLDLHRVIVDVELERGHTPLAMGAGESQVAGFVYLKKKNLKK